MTKETHTPPITKEQVQKALGGTSTTSLEHKHRRTPPFNPSRPKQPSRPQREAVNLEFITGRIARTKK